MMFLCSLNQKSCDHLCLRDAALLVTRNAVSAPDLSPSSLPLETQSQLTCNVLVCPHHKHHWPPQLSVPLQEWGWMASTSAEGVSLGCIWKDACSHGRRRHELSKSSLFSLELKSHGHRGSNTFPFLVSKGQV